MSKELAVKNLLENYVDSLGRVTLKHKSLSDAANHIYDCENQLLISGEAFLLTTDYSYDTIHFRADLFRNVYKYHMIKSRSEHVIPGLYRRQPYNEGKYNTVSKDEYVGIEFMSATSGFFANAKHDIINYGKQTGWSYVDDMPYYNPFKMLIRHPINFIQQIYTYLFKEPDKTNYDRNNYPIIYALAHRRLPNDICFYKVMAGQSPSMFQLLFFLVAAILTTRTPIDDTSSKKMCFWKLKCMNKQATGWITSLVLKFTTNVFDFLMKKKYSNRYYMEDVYKHYYTDPNHPFHELIKGIELE